MGFDCHDKFFDGEGWLIGQLAARHSQLIVVDVGANIGRYASMVRCIAPQSTIYALEPNPALFPELAKASQTFGFSVRQIGLGRKSEKAILHIPYNDQREFSARGSLYDMREFTGLNARATEVNIHDYSSFARIENLQKIDLLKIDVEGHELEVIEGAREAILNGNIQFVQFEFTAHSLLRGMGLPRLRSLLGENFSFWRILPFGLIPVEVDMRANDHNVLIMPKARENEFRTISKLGRASL